MPQPRQTVQPYERAGGVLSRLRPGCQNIQLDLFSFVWTGVFVYHLVPSLSLTPQSPSSEDESVVLAKATFSPKVVTHKMIKQPRILASQFGDTLFFL